MSSKMAGIGYGVSAYAICETLATVRTVLLDSPPSVLSCVNAWLLAGLTYVGFAIYYERGTRNR